MKNSDKNKQKIYIIPTSYGFYFLSTSIVIIVAGGTYKSNLAFLLGFILFSIFAVIMIQTHSNLKNIIPYKLFINDGFAGRPINGDWVLKNPEAGIKTDINLEFKGTDGKWKKLNGKIDIPPEGSIKHSFYLPSFERGVYENLQFRFVSKFPLGLFRTWYRIPTQTKFYVYPKPFGNFQIDGQRSFYKKGQESTSQWSGGGEDFREFKMFEVGEPPNRVAWKYFARTGRLYTKQFEGESDWIYKFDFNNAGKGSFEERLGQLTRWITVAENRRQAYELIIDHKNTKSSQGLTHYRNCLRQLAKWESAA